MVVGRIAEGGNCSPAEETQSIGIGPLKNFSYFGSAAFAPGTLLRWASFFRPGASVMAS